MRGKRKEMANESYHPHGLMLLSGAFSLLKSHVLSLLAISFSIVCFPFLIISNFQLFLFLGFS